MFVEWSNNRLIICIWPESIIELITRRMSVGDVHLRSGKNNCIYRVGDPRMV